MTTFRKEQKWPFDPTPGVVGVCNDSILAFMVPCAQFPLIWYATWLLSVKDIVWPFDPTIWVKGVSVGKIFATMLMPASSALIWYATWLLSEKYIVWPHPWVKGVSVGKILATMLLPASWAKIYSLTPPLGQGCVCGQNISYNVAASVVSFNLICNMTIFWKSFILASAPPPKSTKGAQNHALQTKIPFDIFHIYCCKISAKKY